MTKRSDFKSTARAPKFILDLAWGAFGPSLMIRRYGYNYRFSGYVVRRHNKFVRWDRAEKYIEDEATELDALIDEMVKAEDQFEAPAPREVLQFLIRLAQSGRAGRDQ